MTDIQERLRSIQTRISSVTSKRARDEVEKENAEKAVVAAKAQLAEFGIETGDDLRRVRAELEAEIENLVTEAEAQLDIAEA